jgi:hypothetical protein
MGNRAVITTKDKKIGMYLHWNGGRDSVEPMLKYCELQGYRSPSNDCYGWARLAQVAANFFGGTLCVGIDLYENLCGYCDNGVYIIDGWEIVGREYFSGAEQKSHDFNEMLREFDKNMPEDDRLGDYLDAIEIPVSDVQLGDEVYMRNVHDGFKPYKVVGFGMDKYVNGRKRIGVPYVDMYDHDGDYSWNVNNYVSGDTCKIKPRY